MAEKKEKSEAEKPAPNIQYVGRRQKLDKETGKMETVPKEIPAFIIDGKAKIILPGGIENGVFVEPETAAKLLSLRPDDFKIPVEKGAKNNNEVNE